MTAKIPGGYTRKGPDYLRGTHILVIESPFYTEICDLLIEGAIAELTKAVATYERVSVPGALEIPQALAAAADAYDAQSKSFDGAIALGCVIRGETAHFDIVCNMTNYWLMEVATRRGIAVGNGILTVDTKEQALARASNSNGGKGADAARACLSLIQLRKKLILG